MKRITLFSIFFIFIISSTAQALTRAYPFVVWEGKVYEVKQEEIIVNSEISKMIGKVSEKVNDMTGEYYGDASNYYAKGTKYYEIRGISTFTAIAIKEDNQWVKAVYVHKATFHLMNIFSNLFFLAAVLIVVMILIGVIFRNKKNKN
ncbi:hypothetical protein PB01_10625 [Psychrobacillus glaciei]|uniref:Uncharacterized protein n=1 Tax=Psychrobacillus glaciei TaxID=2283160 RepID=A0A5J6SN91_9BACI|nr:hypothetical protein [Psychrobacillus glaciei]QFF99249.1 hypothetical protein PB01_10625 [Psychrobacillus glaciei]